MTHPKKCTCRKCYVKAYKANWDQDHRGHNREYKRKYRENQERRKAEIDK